MYSFLEKKEDFYRGFTSKPRQMPIKSINSRKFNYLLTFNSLSFSYKFYFNDCKHLHNRIYAAKQSIYAYNMQMLAQRNNNKYNKSEVI